MILNLFYNYRDFSILKFKWYSKQLSNPPKGNYTGYMPISYSNFLIIRLRKISFQNYLDSYES